MSSRASHSPEDSENRASRTTAAVSLSQQLTALLEVGNCADFNALRPDEPIEIRGIRIENLSATALNLRDVTFVDCILRSVELESPSISGTTFRGCSIDGLTVSDTQALGTTLAFTSCEIQGLSLYNVNLIRLDITNSSLHNSHCTSCSIGNFTITHTPITDCSFARITSNSLFAVQYFDALSATFTECTFSNSRITQGVLQRVSFEECVIPGLLLEHLSSSKNASVKLSFSEAPNLILRGFSGKKFEITIEDTKAEGVRFEHLSAPLSTLGITRVEAKKLQLLSCQLRSFSATNLAAPDSSISSSTIGVMTVVRADLKRLIITSSSISASGKCTICELDKLSVSLSSFTSVNFDYCDLRQATTDQSSFTSCNLTNACVAEAARIFTKGRRGSLTVGGSCFETEPTHEWVRVFGAEAPLPGSRSLDEALIVPLQDEASTKQILGGLYGLTELKDWYNEVTSTVSLRSLYAAAGRRYPELGGGIATPLLLVGDTGSGRTTALQLLAGPLAKLGIVDSPSVTVLKKGDLVAGYVGQTSGRAEKAISKGAGGIVYFPNADLIPDHRADDDFGDAAIAEIISFITNHTEKKNSLVVLATSPHKVDQLLEAHPLLPTLFRRINCSSLLPLDLSKILCTFFQKHELTVTPTAFASILVLIHSMYVENAEHSGTHELTPENVLLLGTTCFQRCNRRLTNQRVVYPDELGKIEFADVPQEMYLSRPFTVDFVNSLRWSASEEPAAQGLTIAVALDQLRSFETLELPRLTHHSLQKLSTELKRR